MQKKKISQSFTKAMGVYIYHHNQSDRIDVGTSPTECGLYFKKKYVDGLEEEPTKPQNLGNWFEFICTGQLPRDGKEPIPPTLKSGKLPTDYIRMEKQAENYKSLMDHHGFKILNTGHSFNTHDTLTGISDVMAEKDGKLCVIDIKSTGLIDDLYTPYGWGLERIEEKPDLLIQAIQYTVLARHEFDRDVDFYFAIFSTKNENKYRLIKVDVSQEAIDNHERETEFASIKFKEAEENGYKSAPSYDRCSNCSLKSECLEAVKIPEIVTIYC